MILWGRKIITDRCCGGRKKSDVEMFLTFAQMVGSSVLLGQRSGSDGAVALTTKPRVRPYFSVGFRTRAKYSAGRKLKNVCPCVLA